MTYKMHMAEPRHEEEVYSTVQALENLIQKINEAETRDQYEHIVSAFPLGHCAVVITETRYMR